MPVLLQAPEPPCTMLVQARQLLQHLRVSLRLMVSRASALRDLMRADGFGLLQYHWQGVLFCQHEIVQHQTQCNTVSLRLGHPSGKH